MVCRYECVCRTTRYNHIILILSRRAPFWRASTTSVPFITTTPRSFCLSNWRPSHPSADWAVSADQSADHPGGTADPRTNQCSWTPNTFPANIPVPEPSKCGYWDTCSSCIISKSAIGDAPTAYLSLYRINSRPSFISMKQTDDTDWHDTDSPAYNCAWYYR